MISDAEGNVIRADGSAVIMDGSWTCNGVVLTKKEGENLWVNVEKKWHLIYTGRNVWIFGQAYHGGGSAIFQAPEYATKLGFLIDGVWYHATIGRADSVVMAGDISNIIDKNLSEVINNEITKRLSAVDPDNASVYDLIKALKGE